MISTTESSAALLGIARAWTPLTEAVQDARQHAWPPLTLRQYLAQRGDEEELEARTWRAEALRALERDPAQIGRRPVPLRLDLIGTIALIEAGLLELADTTAAHVQRPPVSMPRPRRAAYATSRAQRIVWEDHARRVAAAQADAADPRRWRYADPRTGRHRQSGREAALWLLGRVTGAPGPFLSLPGPLRERIARASVQAEACIDQALGLGAGHTTLAMPCTCGGRIRLYGDGTLPTAMCTGPCARTWHAAATPA
ncbi:hypothetical protein [Streptomyces sp. t39]|uniref:hypothetical protein n=1 Tax=Streptomyces sp. t39 TaxID=1828156 RepID=UPI0011CE2B53|nr:hypothetical protein [Streptomyces sp. t39]TXS35133.1 hypothetical protein EAO77_37725 [Streptomyces sp. t39]